MDKAKLQAVRRLCQKTGMLQVYAERVIEGDMTFDTALRQSFDAVRGNSPSHRVAAAADLDLARPRSVVLTFEISQEAAQKVLLALEMCRRDLDEGASRGDALVELVNRYVALDAGTEGGRNDR